MITHIPQQLWMSTRIVLKSAPIMTKAATSATVYTIGDIIAEESTGTELGDIDRCGPCRHVGRWIGHGPLSHYWYHISDSLFNDVCALDRVVVVHSESCLDQSAWGPVWNNSYILLLGAHATGESREYAW
jgi:protein Mpv17